MTRKNFFKGKSVIKIIGGIIAGLVIACLLAFVFGLVVMLLWNWLMPDIFNLPEIGYWQGFGLILLAKILFGFGGHGEDKPSKRKKKKDNDGHYDEWWNSEGKSRFDEYFEKKKSEKEESI